MELSFFVNYWRAIMNEYFNTFLNLDKSIAQLLKDEHNSLEIKQFATSLKKSVQPCVEELKYSAVKLNGLVQGCFYDLYHAEDIWNSKPKKELALVTKRALLSRYSLKLIINMKK
jgi:hypothetical protein